MIPVLPPPFVPLIHNSQVVGNINVTGYRFDADDENALKVVVIDGPTPHTGAYVLSAFSPILPSVLEDTTILVFVHEDEDPRKLSPVLAQVQGALEIARVVRDRLDAEKAAAPADATTH